MGTSAKTAGQVIAALPIGSFKTICKIAPMGSLQARKQTAGGVSLYWRYSIGEKSDRVSLGLYDPAAPPKSLLPTPKGFSLAAAQRAAEQMAIEHHQHREEGGRPALLAAKQAASEAAAEEKRSASVHTLANLLNAYADYLEKIGRVSHADARGIFRKHVIGAWPKIAAMPAKTVTGEHIADMMRTLIEAGKGRTANKLRSYARSAFQVAKAAKSKPSIPVAFKAYAIKVNPVADTEPDENHNRADKDPLSAQELRVYWRIIRKLPGLKGAALRLHLLSGGQRIAQLVALKNADVHADHLVLLDGKGRPGKPPREHAVPMLEATAAALADLQRVGVYALSTDEGKGHLVPQTLSNWAAEAVGDQIPRFLLKRIRSGVETYLASAGVSQDTRGRLQSHGQAGVQTRHYDAYDYLPEKRAALLALYQWLEAADSNKVALLKASKGT